MPVACGSTPEIKLCGEIPDGGCPLGHGGTCDDVTCAAIYDCVDGAWTRVETCGPRDGGGGASTASTSAAGGANDGGGNDACTMVMFDHSMETADCQIDLQNPPDCPAAAA